MSKRGDITVRKSAAGRIFSILMVMLLSAVMFAPAGPAFAAASQDESEKPVREVHKVGIGDKQYCFFVTHNVVLTQAEIQKMTDKELTSYILETSGMYMKETNCHKSSSKKITAEGWIKDGGSFRLSDKDIESIRQAEPVDGSPVKLHMDLIVSTDPADEEEPAPADDAGEGGEGTEAGETGDGSDSGDGGGQESGQAEQKHEYSTFKRTTPRLLFVAIATETDAAYGEDICDEEKKPDDSGKAEPEPEKKEQPPAGKIPPPGGGSGEQMLPELRTIKMTDRSGGPIEPTLQDGTPVNLKWIEPANHPVSDDSSFWSHIPGGAAGLAYITGVLALIIAAIVFIIRKIRRTTEEE